MTRILLHPRCRRNLFTSYFRFERAGDEPTHRAPSFVPLARLMSSMRSAGRASTGLINGVGCIVWVVAPARCAPVLACWFFRWCSLSGSHLFLSLLSFVVAFAFTCLSAHSCHLRRPIRLRTTGLASSFERGRSSRRDLTCLLRGLACSRFPGYFLACACRWYPRIPGICGVEAARRVISTQARWG